MTDAGTTAMRFRDPARARALAARLHALVAAAGRPISVWASAKDIAVPGTLSMSP